MCICVLSGRTAPPPLLSESDLISEVRYIADYGRLDEIDSR
jgi:hypothetical protein